MMMMMRSSAASLEHIVVVACSSHVHVYPDFKARFCSLPAKIVRCSSVSSSSSASALSVCRISDRNGFRRRGNVKVSSSSSRGRVGIARAEIGSDEDASGVRARVRVQLQKQCMFGEKFGLVGEDPRLGSWNAEEAVPMEWSPGDIWITPHLDLPAGKNILFKFILTDQMGEIQWQPGPDRMFQTWQTSSSILVSQDWESLSTFVVEEEEAAAEEERFEDQQRLQFMQVESGIDLQDAEMDTLASVYQEQEKVEEGYDDGKVPVLVPGMLTAVSPSNVSEENAGPLSIENSNLATDYEQNNQYTTSAPINDSVDFREGESSSSSETPFLKEEEAASSVVEPDKNYLLSGLSKGDVYHILSMSSAANDGGEHATSPDIDKGEEEPKVVNHRTGDSLFEGDLEWGRKALYKLIGSLGLRLE